MRAQTQTPSRQTPRRAQASSTTPAHGQDQLIAGVPSRQRAETNLRAVTALQRRCHLPGRSHRRLQQKHGRQPHREGCATGDGGRGATRSSRGSLRCKPRSPYARSGASLLDLSFQRRYLGTKLLFCPRIVAQQLTSYDLAPAKLAYRRGLASTASRGALNDPRTPPAQDVLSQCPALRDRRRR
jgi:hypothetical protein